MASGVTAWARGERLLVSAALFRSRERAVRGRRTLGALRPPRRLDDAPEDQPGQRGVDLAAHRQRAGRPDVLARESGRRHATSAVPQFDLSQDCEEIHHGHGVRIHT